ncbi:hypothetical protein AB1N83_007214 [Pleurotus pulmonarius]
MSSSIDLPDLTPGGLINDEGNYILQDVDINNLMAYIWTGVLLATDKAKYLLRVGITSAQFDQHKDLINPVIGTYTKIQGSTTTFKNVTYPGIVALADRVYEFASNSGGTVETSYYAFVFDQIHLLAAEVAKPVGQQDPKLIAEYRETIKAIIDSQVAAIEVLAKDAETATDDLRKFEEVSTLQQTELRGNAGTLKTTLENADGNITILSDRINEARKEIRALQAEYKTAMTNANIAAGFMWNLGGIIAFGIYMDQARKLKDRIDAIQRTLNQDEVELKATLALVSEVSLVEIDVDDVIKLIEPAMAAINKMMAFWSAVAGDLTSLQNYVDKDVRNVSAALTTLIARNVVSKWNDLKDAVHKYRLVAYARQPPVMTLAEVSRELEKHINALEAAERAQKVAVAVA